jgi:transposase, IS30 family
MLYQHINAKERHSLMYLLQMNLSHREIGRRLNRSHTSISREVKRNGRLHNWCYVDDVAHQKAQQRYCKARHKKKRNHHSLYALVLKKLQLGWSPDAISGWLKARSTKPLKWVTRETIYRWIYSDAAEGGKLYQQLPTQRPKRKKQRKDRLKVSLIPNRVGIENRPAAIDTRCRFGHWEGDTVEGKKSCGGMATHIERKSRYLLAGKIHGKTSAEFARVTQKLFSAIPTNMRKTLTLDNGTENVLHGEITKACALTIFFARAYSPWERGANEHANGLLRRRFPKGIDFRKVTDEDVQAEVKRINQTPRKSLNYRTPEEVFLKAAGGALGK